MAKPKIIQMDQIQLQIVLLFKQGRAQTQPHKQGMIQMSKVGNLRSHLVSLHNLQQIKQTLYYQESKCSLTKYIMHNVKLISSMIGRIV